MLTFVPSSVSIFPSKPLPHQHLTTTTITSSTSSTYTSTISSSFAFFSSSSSFFDKSSRSSLWTTPRSRSRFRSRSSPKNGGSSRVTAVMMDQVPAVRESQEVGQGKVVHYYRSVDVANADLAKIRKALAGTIGSSSFELDVVKEECFNVEITKDSLTEKENTVLSWLLAETFEPEKLGVQSKLSIPDVISLSNNQTLEFGFEVGPRLNFETAWSSNAVSICKACGLSDIVRLERSRRYMIRVHKLPQVYHPEPEIKDHVVRVLCDRMTEQLYLHTLQSFDSGLVPGAIEFVPLILKGKQALVDINREMGFGFDQQDIEYYYKMFMDLNRNPTNVELFDMAQSNSEHSRHWFFKGKLIIDGQPAEKHLFDLVKDTLKANPNNSCIAFADNSSTIRGIVVDTLRPTSPGKPSSFQPTKVDLDILFTSETHNFPSGVAPFPGAETGTGGRIRDTAATGTGSIVVAGTAGYSVGNLNIPGYPLPWEDKSFQYPSNLASPLDILIEASNGASDYGNKFGEPVIQGFTRTFGMRTSAGERREYVKPIMFSGGMGQMDHRHKTKGKSEIGLVVTKVGGPAYRIGMGGGAASSMVQGENRTDLDFNAVQRGDAEMEQKTYRVLRACVEMGENNPIVSIHDQGAGGSCNVVKELIYPGGGKIDLRQIWIGDKSLSALEIWGAEYQEQFGLLLRPESIPLFNELCKRENVVPSYLGEIDGSNKIVLWDSQAQMNAVDLDLELVLGDLPQKLFTDNRVAIKTEPFNESVALADALDRVLRNVSVCSKRFLTTKVDRSVTGLIAQQQCVGPLQLPISDVAVTAQSHFQTTGSATGIGERPLTTLLSPQAMARMCVGEMLTNIGAAKIPKLEDIKCEGNWMWAAKLPGEGAAIYDAVLALRDILIKLGTAIDGGKDSLSMAALCPNKDGGKETVKAPGTLVISGYAPCPDVTITKTPDLKRPGKSSLVHVDIANGKRRTGASILAQVYNKLGETCPDMDDPDLMKRAFTVLQDILAKDHRQILSYHDISDGGLITTLLEMAFAGNCGLDIKLDSKAMGVSAIANLFAEELGVILEVSDDSVDPVMATLKASNVPCNLIGTTKTGYGIKIQDGEDVILDRDVRELRDTWEATAFELEKLQANPKCVEQEQVGLKLRTGPKFSVSFTPKATDKSILSSTSKHKVAILREEGSNGDREMTSAFYLAGFDVWDVCMRDLASGSVNLADFRGVVFVGGFSYADVMDSAKGWAGVIRYKESIKSQFKDFFARNDTFSLGICNGCQLGALVGIVPFGMDSIPETYQPRFIHNESGRFESRFTAVKIDASPSIMLQGMEESILGVWSAHGEGRAYFPEKSILEKVKAQKLAPVKYMDDEGKVALEYPFNPNGSTEGIAGLCSADGRHLAMMPHPERVVLKWQWGYMPEELNEKLDVSPWLKMFQNAREWCDQH